jgi:post-segregation antitoxin (ccd killing protein)
MSKKITTLHLDENIVKEAKKRLYNVSGAVERALKERLKIQEVEIKESLECEWCGREEKKAYVDEIGELHDGLTWLYPDEKWICANCLRGGARYS